MEVADTLLDYFNAGIVLVWVIYPRHRWIYVYRSPTDVRVLTEADELDGDAAIPGFRLKIADLFAALVRPQ
jgi:Uma2 family endonuclease